ncbi:MAG: DUF4345 domain-containing protein [Pseudomonadales bacterium]
MLRYIKMLQKILLLIAGAILLLVSGYILVSPLAFYASNGIVLGSNISLINELKAPAGFLLVAGAFMIRTLLKRGPEELALKLAAVIYLSYALSRFASMGIDGSPASGLIQAATLELTIGVSCLAALFLHRFLPRTYA